MKRIILSIVISISLILASVPVYAETDLIVDLGKQIGTGGLSDGGWSAELPGIGVAISLGLMAGGIEAQTYQDALGQQMTPTEYTIKQFTDWVNSTPLSYENVSKIFQDGLSFAENGLIYFGQEVTDVIAKFGNWIVSNANDNFISDTGGAVEGDSAYAIIDGNKFLYNNYLSIKKKPTTGTAYGLEYFYSSAKIAFIYYSIGHGLYFLATEPFTVTRGVVASNGTTSYTTYNSNNKISGSDFYPCTAGGPSTSLFDYSDVPQYTGYPSDYFTNVKMSDIDVVDPNAPSTDAFVGNPNTWASFVPGLSLPAGYTGAIDPGVLTGLSDAITNIGNHVITIEDYIEALADAIDGTADTVIVYEDSTGTAISVPIPDVIVPDPVYDPVADPDKPDEVTYPYTPVIPATPDSLMDQPLTLSLKDIFPFCIPFDIYDILSKFDVPAEAPKINIDYTFPLVNVRWQYEVDFSPFNSVAQVLRTMELVAAIVGLALATRAIYIRS